MTNPAEVLRSIAVTWGEQIDYEVDHEAFDRFAAYCNEEEALTDVRQRMAHVILWGSLAKTLREAIMRRFETNIERITDNAPAATEQGASGTD